MKTEQISFRLPAPLLSCIDELAKEEIRTRTNMIEFMLVDWLREHRPNAYGEYFDEVHPVDVEDTPGRG